MKPADLAKKRTAKKQKRKSKGHKIKQVVLKPAPKFVDKLADSDTVIL